MCLILSFSFIITAGCQPNEKEKAQQQKIEQQQKEIDELKRNQNKVPSTPKENKKKDTVQQLPLKFSNFEVSSRVELNRLIVRVSWVVENTSDSSIYLNRDNFILKKDGHNGVRSHYEDGGFSKTIDKPLYMHENYTMYPGDRIAVSMDFWTDETEPGASVGWQLNYANGGKLTPIMTISGVK